MPDKDQHHSSDSVVRAANPTPVIIRRRRLFRLLLAAIVLLVLSLLGLAAEMLLRIQQQRRIDARIVELEHLTKSSVTYNRALLSCYRGRKEEAGLHFLTRRKIPNAYRPYIEHRRVPFQNASVRINSLGYRGPEFAIPKHDDAFRILIYGGSMAWGTGALTDAETVAGQLQALLNENPDGATRYEVINCAETAFSSTQEVVYLLTEGVLLSPDLVIFIDGVNDAGLGYTDQPAGYPFMFRQISARMTTGRKISEEYTIEDELSYLRTKRDGVWRFESLMVLDQLGDLVRRAQDASTTWRKGSHTSPEEYAIRNYYNMRCARALGRSFGFEAGAAPQPIPFLFKPLHQEESTAIQSLRQKDSYYDRIAWWEDSYLNYTDRVLSLCKSSGIPTYDLRRVFEDNADLLYIDDCHLNGQAHRIMAEALLGWITSAGLLSKRPPSTSAFKPASSQQRAKLDPAHLERLIRTNATYGEHELKIATKDSRFELPPCPAFPAGRRTYRPYIEYLRMADGNSTAAFNSLGYRGPEFRVDKPDDVFRILIYGGSFVAGEHVPDEETITSQLQWILNQHTGQPPAIEVINCGEPGFNSTQSAVYLLVEGVYLNPDVVLFINGAHEAGRAPSNLPAGYPFFFDRINALMTQGERFRSMYSFEDEAQSLRQQRRLVAAHSSGLELEALPEHTTTEEFAARYSVNLRCLRGLAEEFGFKACAAIQPLPFFHKPLTEAERTAIVRSRENPDRCELIAWREQHYEALADRMIQASRHERVPQLDLRRAFAETEETIYVDDALPNGKGYRHVAETLAEWMLDQGLVPPRLDDSDGRG